METVVPISMPQGPTVSAPLPTAQLSTPPPELLRLEVGAKLDALIMQGTLKGVAEIDSSFGKLRISTNFPLPAQASLQLQIIGKFPQMQFLITSLQGQTPQAALRAMTAGASSLQPGAGQGTAGTGLIPASVSLSIGTNVVATKIGAPPASALLPSQQSAPTAMPGTTLSGTKTQPGGGSTQQSSATTPLPSASANSSSSPHTSGSGAQKSANASINQTGNQFSVRLTHILPPSQLSSGGGLPASGSSTLAVGQSVTGVVTMTNSHGQAVVQTHAGPISIAAPSPLPPGTTVSFFINEPLAFNLKNAISPLAGRSAEVIMETHKWPELDDAVRTLTEGHPTLGQQVINSLLPKADATLAANIILLISAIRGGDIRNWFGDAPVRALQRLKPDLMARLRDDFLQISRLSDDNVSSDWRSFPVPFLNGQEIEQIRLYLKRKSDDDDKTSDADQGTRFILDLDLSHMGRLQLDGLVRASKKQFDLIIRTDQPLDKVIQMGIRDIYKKATEQSGTGGGLTFQAAPANFIDICSDGALSSDMGLIV